jgi:tetratricopeptide (TPR) repeat protein
MNDKYQNFLDKLKNTDESERDWLVMEFSLQNLSDALRQAVWAAAIPHWFDHAYLNAVLGFPLKDQDFKALTELSFVEIFPERGFNIHERSRNLLLGHLWKSNKARYQKLSKRAATFCKKQDQAIAAWRIENLYHGLLANNATAKQNFISQALAWSNNFQYDNLESLTHVILEAVSSSKLTGEVTAWSAFWQARLDIIFSRYSSAQELLQQSLKYKANNSLTANCTLFLGDVHLHLGEYSLARDFYQQALPFYQQLNDRIGEANCIQALGDVHCYFAEYDQARACYQQALLINSQEEEKNVGEANCIQALGDVHYYIAEYGQARGYYQEALLIYQKIKEHLGEANCIRSLGLTDGAEQKITFAFTKLQQAAQLFEVFGNKRSQANCFDDLAILYQRQRQFASALTAFNQAIDIFPDGVHWYQNRAALYMAMENYPAAKADIKQAEILGKAHSYTLLRKAEFALWQQQTPQAVEFCWQALAQRPADGNIRTIYALTLLADRQVQLAFREMEQALTAVYHRHDFDDLLDALDKLSRIYGDSVEVDALRELILKRYPK